MPEIIRVKETSQLFLTKQGLPKKEFLLDINQICNALGKPIPENQPYRTYYRGGAVSVMSKVKKNFYKHHILFINPKIDGVVYYGFSSDLEKINNCINRVEKVVKSYKVIEKKAKTLSKDQKYFPSLFS